MAGAEPFLLDGGMGNASVLASRSPSIGRGIGLRVQPHHNVVALVLVAVLVLIALDKAGFRFAVTAGRR